uniref:Zona pellucida sperm-binding protein 3 n=1 Tax=Cyprinodon variegatus TaxID=28743 RepID=A0A3Q2G9Z0_CYPVA
MRCCLTSLSLYKTKLVNTVSVMCHPDSMEVVITADMFAVGAPVDSRELRLGVEDNELCRAKATSAEEYRIVAGLDDCGTKHWMTKDALIYTNLLMYSPLPNPSGIIHMEEAVIPVECHYERFLFNANLDSFHIDPSWIHFSPLISSSTFNLSLISPPDDWMHERGANVFYLGEPIHLEASVRVGHHMGLRVFLSSCVATLQPDANSDPKYSFIENGCLMDSQLPNSKAQFLPRTKDDVLQLTIDAFKFHNDNRGQVRMRSITLKCNLRFILTCLFLQLYITCHLTAVPVNDAETPNKACTYMNGR